MRFTGCCIEQRPLATVIPTEVPVRNAVKGSSVTKRDLANRRGFSTRSPKEFFEPVSLARNDGLGESPSPI
jgi:hypothetical protein